MEFIVTTTICGNQLANSVVIVNCLHVHSCYQLIMPEKFL